MILLDANVLLYAYDERAAGHKPMRAWLERILSGTETVGLPWITVWAFIRITTNPRLNEQPLTAEDAIGIMSELLRHPLVVMVSPGRRHMELLWEQMRSAQVAGRETTDAVLAAMAVEQGATLASADAGFRRFPDVKWLNPLIG